MYQDDEFILFWKYSKIFSEIPEMWEKVAETRSKSCINLSWKLSLSLVFQLQTCRPQHHHQLQHCKAQATESNPIMIITSLTWQRLLRQRTNMNLNLQRRRPFLLRPDNRLFPSLKASPSLIGLWVFCSAGLFYRNFLSDLNTDWRWWPRYGVMLEMLKDQTFCKY